KREEKPPVIIPSIPTPTAPTPSPGIITAPAPGTTPTGVTFGPDSISVMLPEGSTTVKYTKSGAVESLTVGGLTYKWNPDHKIYEPTDIEAYLSQWKEEYKKIRPDASAEEIENAVSYMRQILSAKLPSPQEFAALQSAKVLSHTSEEWAILKKWAFLKELTAKLEQLRQKAENEAQLLKNLKELPTEALRYAAECPALSPEVKKKIEEELKTRETTDPFLRKLYGGMSGEEYYKTTQVVTGYKVEAVPAPEWEAKYGAGTQRLRYTPIQESIAKSEEEAKKLAAIDAEALRIAREKLDAKLKEGLSSSDPEIRGIVKGTVKYESVLRDYYERERRRLLETMGLLEVKPAPVIVAYSIPKVCRSPEGYYYVCG
ncbi:MAG: hypothetical protein QXZ17_05650, partial [Nitrososphaerota archaeon]